MWSCFQRFMMWCCFFLRPRRGRRGFQPTIYRRLRRLRRAGLRLRHTRLPTLCFSFPNLQTTFLCFRLCFAISNLLETSLDYRFDFRLFFSAFFMQV